MIDVSTTTTRWDCNALGTVAVSCESKLILTFKFSCCHLSLSDPNGWSSEGYSLSSSTTESQSKQDGNRREEMKKARERQQKIADERAKEAAILRKEKERQEKDRKNQAALKKYPGDRLGDGKPQNNTSRSTSSSSSRLRSNDYNPMQPWNTSTSSYRYVLYAIMKRLHPKLDGATRIAHSKLYCLELMLRVRHSFRKQTIEANSSWRRVVRSPRVLGQTFLFLSLTGHPLHFRFRKVHYSEQQRNGNKFVAILFRQ